MEKKIVLNTPHAQTPVVNTYRLASMTVQYEIGTTLIDLIGEAGQKFTIGVNAIPPTTQEQAVLALINNGVLAGNIENA